MARCPRKLLAVAAAVPLALICACGSGPGPGAAAARPAATADSADSILPASPGRQTITLSASGSTLLYPLLQAWAGEYHFLYPQVTIAATATGSGAGIARAAAAAREAPAWYAANEQVYRLDVAADYRAETRLVTGTGPGRCAAAFEHLEAELSQAISADQVAFRSSAAAGAAAFTGLEAAIITASLIMAGGCAWGLNRRLEEYRG